MSQVNIVQKWNGTSKVPLHLLYSKFLAYLIDQGSKVVKHDNNKTYTFCQKMPSLHIWHKRIPGY